LTGGLRADPLLHLAKKSGYLTVYMDKFWQNFPSSLSVSEGTVACKLFPGEHPDVHELQGGERKLQTVYLEVSDSNTSARGQFANLEIRVPTDYIQSTGVISYYCDAVSDNAIDHLLSQGIEGDRSFIQKREMIDEYGWRNFGELYADHESFYVSDELCPHLISHYNNQYDPIYGFLVQYLKTANADWKKLADDLAAHVLDIDIYSTSQDRAEFNNGLFWHTEHYKPALTATHRTYSRLHYQDDEDLALGGGGPSEEHCYTTGLVYHYFLTGDERSRDAVLKLGRWMEHIHNGEPCIFGQLDSIRKRDLKVIKALISRKSGKIYRYPFTRGTGNYVNALLDCFNLTGERSWLDKAEQVIAETLHPNDDIESRGFDNVEHTWSFIVMLGVIDKYLHIKEECGCHDEQYEYAKSALMHYCQWMYKNDKFYLDQKDSIDIPNDTWAAQEIRKSNLMCIAARHDVDRKQAYLVKAKEYSEYAYTALQDSPETAFTRIQVILLQNYLIQDCLYSEKYSYFESAFSGTRTVPKVDEVPTNSVKKTLTSVFRKLIYGVRNSSLSAEKQWLESKIVSRKAN